MKLIAYNKFSRIKKADRIFILEFLGLPKGPMRQEAKEGNCPCVVAYNDEGTPIGWVAMPTFKGEKEIHTFVDYNHRKKGIGTKIVQKILATYWKPGEPIGSYSSTNQSTNLYKKFDNCYDRYDDRFGD